jgi:putative methyltransferase (TIGR04325 family)
VSWRNWLIPPAVSKWAGGRSRHQTCFDDSVVSWNAAVDRSTGYDSDLIVQKVTRATEQVFRGESAFERDGVTFNLNEYRWPVLSALLNVAAREGELRVLDFGGSLGSVFWQHRAMLTGINVKWGVVEQPNFVDAGRSLAQESVEFFDSVESCNSAFTPNVILLSSVLQYLPEPEQILRQLLATHANSVIIDRTPISDTGANIRDKTACLQVVPAHIYSASYPAWVFSRSWINAQLVGFEVLAEFPGIEPVGHTSGGLEFTWDGLVARRKSHD